MDGTPSREAACDAAAEVFKALSTPGRLLILCRLADAPACVHELVDELPMSQPLTSQHLRVLREAGLIRGTRRGREIVYATADAHVVHIVTDAIEHIAEQRRPGADPITEEEHSP